MKKHNSLMLLLLAFLVSGVCILLLSSSTVIGAMAGAFLGAVGAYTTLDLKAMVKATGQMPAGLYKEAEKWKYFTGILLLVLMLGISFFKQQISGLNLELAYGFLGPGIVVIITMVISGLKLNKSATLDGLSRSSGGS